MGEHGRAEWGRVGRIRPLFAPLDPGEKIEPDVLDVIGLYARAVFCGKLRDGGFRQPRRDADAKRAGDQFQQGPAAGLVQRVEPGGELARQVELAAPA